MFDELERLVADHGHGLPSVLLIMLSMLSLVLLICIITTFIFIYKFYIRPSRTGVLVFNNRREHCSLQSTSPEYEKISYVSF